MSLVATFWLASLIVVLASNWKLFDQLAGVKKATATLLPFDVGG